MSENLLGLARRVAESRRVQMGAWTGDLGRRFAFDLMGIHPEQASAETEMFALAVCNTNAKALAHSELFLADDDMVDLIDTAAPTMPDQELAESDMLAESGFLYFASPLPDRSGTEPVSPIHALSWTWLPPQHRLLKDRGDGEHPGVLIHSYVHTLDYSRACGIPADALPPGAPRLMPNATAIWGVATLIGTVFGEVPQDPRHTPGFYQRVAAAFWTLTRQSLTTKSEAPPGASADRKRAARAGVVDPSAPVKIVRLRSGVHDTPGATGGESGRKVGVRFPVRGFWRAQYLPSTQSHRQQWIAPHWRGPEDAPISGGERVFVAHGHPPAGGQR